MDWNGTSILKNILFLMILFESLLLASDEDIATKIYISIAKELSHKTHPTFYLHGTIKHLNKNKKIPTSLTCEQADIIVLNTLEKLPKNCKEKLLFTNSYNVYAQDENIIGAFFWQKGRPNIIFNKNVLERKNIILSPSFNKYVE